MKDKERYKWLVEPYMQTTAIKWLEECNQMNRPPDGGREFSFDRVSEVLNSLANLPETDMHKTDCETMIGVIHRGLGKLKEAHPSAYHEALFLVECTATIGWMAAESILLANHFDQAGKFKAIHGLNSDRAAVAERAKSLSRELWASDITREIRIGDMAERVYRLLAKEGFLDVLPGTAERIKEWIKPVAPDYARKGGRRKKLDRSV